jgi:hypothetical protein
MRRSGTNIRIPWAAWYVGLAIAVAVAFFRIHSFHSGYPFPYHHDEWQHLAISISTIEQGHVPDTNPYLAHEPLHTNLEPGFHFLLSNIILLTGIDGVTLYSYLPALMVSLYAIVVFACLRRLTGEPFIGLLGAFMVSSLKSNVNILGLDYFVPFTLAMPFIFLSVTWLSALKDDKDVRSIVLTCAFLITLLAIHPPSFMIVGIASIAYIAANIRGYVNLEKKHYFFALAGMIAVALAFFLLIELYGLSIPQILQKVLFRKGWGLVEQEFFLPSFYGIVATSFGLIGFLKGMKTRLSIFIYMAFASVLLSFMYINLDFTVLIPYQRVVHHFAFSMIPLTSLGIWAAFEAASARIWKQPSKSQSAIFISKILAAALILALMFSSGYKVNEDLKRYKVRVVEEDSYDALMWADDNLGRNSTILVPLTLTSAVYPLTGLRIVALAPAQMGGKNSDLNAWFYELDCDSKKRILYELRPDYAFSPDPLYCDSMTEIYSDRYHIYRVTYYDVPG